jgi:choline-sulfatase
VHYHDLDALNDDEVFFYRLNAIYLDMVHNVDTELGELLAAIDNNKNAPGLADRTAFFVSSDHGDFGGDHHLIEKWPGALDDVLTRVPFVARIPGGAKGHVVREQIQVFDILPTALEMAGITPNRTHFGRSLVPQLMGANGDLDRVVYCEGGFLYPTEIEPIEGSCDLKDDFYGKRGHEEIQNFTGGCNKSHWDDPNWTGCQGSPRAVMAKTLSHKLVYRPREVSEFYDLAKDPKELVNLFGDASVASVQKKMTDDLLQWYLETTDVSPITVDNVGYPANSSSDWNQTQFEEFWWEKYNPNIHSELKTHRANGELLAPNEGL